jgi:hypothetical protein
VETVLVLEFEADRDRVVEAVVLFERAGDLLDVREASRLLVFIVVAVVKGFCVTGAVSVCAKLNEGLIEIPGGTERVKDVDGVGHDDNDFVAETVGLFDCKEVRLLLGDTETVFEGWRLGEPVVELVVEAVARILFVCVADVVEVLEGALVKLPVEVFIMVTDRTADPETVFVCVEEAETVELGEAVRDSF